MPFQGPRSSLELCSEEITRELEEQPRSEEENAMSVKYTVLNDRGTSRVVEWSTQRRRERDAVKDLTAMSGFSRRVNPDGTCQNPDR